MLTVFLSHAVIPQSLAQSMHPQDLAAGQNIWRIVWIHPGHDCCISASPSHSLMHPILPIQTCPSASILKPSSCPQGPPLGLSPSWQPKSKDWPKIYWADVPELQEVRCWESVSQQLQVYSGDQPPLDRGFLSTIFWPLRVAPQEVLPSLLVQYFLCCFLGLQVCFFCHLLACF